MKAPRHEIIYSSIEYFRFKKESLIKELLVTNNLLNELEQLSIVETGSAPKPAIDWEKEVLCVLESATSPLSKLAIAKLIESKLAYTDHRIAMLNVSSVLVCNLHKKLKKVRVGKSHQFVLNK